MEPRVDRSEVVDGVTGLIVPKGDPEALAQALCRLLKDLDRPLAGRDVLLVEDVVDTGLTLGFLTRCFAERGPASLAAVTLLDRPYRRLVDDVPLEHVGFTVPDQLFAGYGLGLDERWRALPDLHVVVADELPAAIDAA